MKYILDYVTKDGIEGTATLFVPQPPTKGMDQKDYERQMKKFISTMNALNKSLKKHGAKIDWRMLND